MENNAIVFDTKSGFSIEEQEEILKKINSLSVEKGIVPETDFIKSEAKKRGILFPMLVNITAVLLLAGGFFLLWVFHSQGDQELRTGSAVLSLTERVLIQEIRRETNRLLSEKENEISNILTRLAEAGSEYRQLEMSVENLTGEQRARADYLLGLQEEYRDTLSQLQDERTQILEESRMREAGLRVQAEERARELASQIEQSQSNLGAAMEELSRLSNEQERAAAAEAQLGVYYTMADRHINAGNFGEASNVLKLMKEFLDAPVFFHNRSMETRRQIHLTAITALVSVVTEAERLRNSGGVAIAVPQSDGQDEALAELNARYTALMQRTEDLERAFAADGSEQSRIISEHLETIEWLNTANLNQQETLNRRDAELVILRNENSAYTQQIGQINTELDTSRRQSQARITELENRNDELNRTNTALQQQLDAIRQAASSLLN